MTIYSLDVLLSQFWTSPLFHLVLIVAFCPAYRFLRKRVRWSGIPISWRIFYSLLWSIQSKAIAQSVKQKLDVFREFSCFLRDPAYVGNLISGSSAFSKSTLYIWKFSVHILLKCSLKNFEHYLASMWNGCNCTCAQTHLQTYVQAWAFSYFVNLFRHNA